MAFRIVTEYCIVCDICREVCPYAAVRVEPRNGVYHYEIVADRCTECGGLDNAPCVEFCPDKRAIDVVRAT